MKPKSNVHRDSSAIMERPLKQMQKKIYVLKVELVKKAPARRTQQNMMTALKTSQ